MATPGNLSSKKVKNSYKGIVQYDGATSKLYDGTGSMINSVDVTQVTASKAKITTITAGSVSASSVTVDESLAVSGSTYLGDTCGTDQIKIHGNTWVSGALTVSGSCAGTLRSIGQAKFIYLENPGIEDQKPAKVTRISSGYIRGKYNVPRFGGENAALDVYGNAVISGSLIVTDTVFAQEVHTEQISQSIMYTSGSTKFGGDFDDTMTVTGSIFQSGSDAYFLNGVGIGTTGSQKAGTFLNEGQDNPVVFTHLLRLDDPGHDGLQHKNGKLIYGTFGSTGASHVSASDVIRIRDKAKSDDVFVVSSISQSIFFSTNDKYNIGIGVPSASAGGGKVDENLVVSSSTNARIKIESATAATSASLYLQSGQGIWEIAAASSSTGANNQLSESLVFRTNTSKNILDTWTGNGTYTEALRLDNTGKAGFAIPSINGYQYPRQVQISGSLNIIQGRTVSINAGTFHDADGINGIYFNNQKTLYVSGSGLNTNFFFGNDAGKAAGTGRANIGVGYQAGKAITTGDQNVLIGQQAGLAINTGGNNILFGTGAGDAMTNNDYNIGIGYLALSVSANDGDKNIAIGFSSMNLGDVSGDSNIGIGSLSLQDLTTGTNNVAIGNSAALNLTVGAENVAIGYLAMGGEGSQGKNNIAVGQDALYDITTASGSIGIGHDAGRGHTTGNANIAIGSGSMGKGVAIGVTGGGGGNDNIALGSYALEDLTAGGGNVAIGLRAMDELTTGDHNIAIGQLAMSAGVTTGDANIAIGYLSLKDAVTAHNNIAIGFRAMRDAANTAARNVVLGYQVAYDGAFTGLDNIILGTNAAEKATSLSRNVIIGDDAARNGVMTGNQNVIIGVSGSAKITSGHNNIILGSAAGAAVTTNTKNILIGSGSTATAGLSNAYAIGTQASVTQADSLVIGGQTGARFRTGIGGITAPNATLEVSGTMKVTGSMIVSSSATFTNVGRAVLVANQKANAIAASGLPTHRALEVSGTTNFRGHTYVTGNLYVSDIVVAQEFHTEYVSASITFSSGSNKMGDSNDDVQQMTGSFRISGSGFHYFMGRQDSSGNSVAAAASKVGINTMSPTYELDVVGNAGFDEYLYHNDDANTYLRYQADNVSIAAGGEVNVTVIPASVTIGDGGDVDFNVKTSGDANTLYILGSNNNVGIGTNVPTQKLTVAGNISGSGNTSLGNATSDTHTFTGHVTASNNLRIDGNAIIGNGSGDTHTFTGNITASNNISASGYISSSHFAGVSASISNLLVTGSGKNGTGSFGYVFGHTVHIHDHEIVGGQGLTVAGTSTQLGYAQKDGGALDHNVQIYGPTTIAATLWVSESSLANGTGHISGSFISASKGLHTNGNLSVGSITATNITASGEVSASSTGSFAYLVIAPKVGAPVDWNSDVGHTLAEFKGDAESFVIKNSWGTADYYVGNSDYQNGHVYRDGNGGVVTLYNNTVGAQLTEHGTYLQKPAAVTANKHAAAGNVLQVQGNISSSGALTIIGSGSFGGHVTASGNISASGNSHIFGGNITASGNISSSAHIYAVSGTFAGKVLIGSDSSDSRLNTRKAGLYIITSSKGDTHESASMIVLHVSNSGDLHSQRSLIDFKFTDNNANATPQVRIGAEVGTSDTNAGSMNEEGSGAFVVYTTSASSTTAGNNTEKFRVTHDGKVGIGTTTNGTSSIVPGNTLHVSGAITSSGAIKADGDIISYNGVIGGTNYRSFYVAAAGMTPGVTSGPQAGTEEGPGTSNGTNFTTVDYLAFDGGSGNDEYANFQLTMPGEWDRNVIKAKFYFATDTATSATVNFGINFTPVGDNESLGFQSNIFAYSPKAAGGTVTDLNITSATTAVSASGGTSASLDDLLCFRIRREPDVDDTYTGDAHLLGVAIQYREQSTTEAAW